MCQVMDGIKCSALMKRFYSGLDTRSFRYKISFTAYWYQTNLVKRTRPIGPACIWMLLMPFFDSRQFLDLVLELSDMRIRVEFDMHPFVKGRNEIVD